MITAILGGILTGMILAFSTGPIFFTLLQTSIHKGFNKAIYFIVGTSFADTMMIMTCWFGLNQIGIEVDNSIASIIGGVILVLFGLSFIFKKKPTVEESSKPGSKLDGSALFLKAILLDASNPIVWAFWAGIVEYSLSNFDGQFTQITYLAAMLMTILSTDLLKAHFAQKLKSVLSERNMTYLNYGIGVLLIGFGIKLFFI